MTKAIILDLDNCIAAASEIGHHLFSSVFDAIRSANRGALSEAGLQEAFADCWRHSVDWVAAKHGFTEEMIAAAWRVCVAMEVERPMYGYGDLEVLAELPVQRFLVTSGFRRLQESKIRALGAAHLFTAIYIDAVDAIDDPDRKGKHGIFEGILTEYGFRPEEVLVVGDNPEAEIEAGNRLGIRTVQILRPGVPRGDNATFYVEDFPGLRRLLVTE